MARPISRLLSPKIDSWKFGLPHSLIHRDIGALTFEMQKTYCLLVDFEVLIYSSMTSLPFSYMMSNKTRSAYQKFNSRAGRDRVVINTRENLTLPNRVVHGTSAANGTFATVAFIGQRLGYRSTYAMVTGAVFGNRIGTSNMPTCIPTPYRCSCSCWC